MKTDKAENTEYSYCHIVGQTDVGRKRRANEDHGAHFLTPNGLVAVVCDGMGGHVGGAVASQVAVDTIREFLNTVTFEDPRQAISEAIRTANEAVLRRTAVQPELTGMGSTCVLLIVRDGKVFIGHVGDSRIYLIREKVITQLTKDHSFVQTLVDMGRITKEEAEHHPRKNEITNALGLEGMTPATVKETPIEPQAGDCFLLCSDGLSGMVDDRHIERIVSEQRKFTSQQRADMLVNAANENGGLDNITVEMVEFSVTPSGCSGAVVKKKVIKPWMIAAAAAVFIIGAGAGIRAALRGKTASDIHRTLDDITIKKGEASVLFELIQTNGHWVLYDKDQNPVDSLSDIKKEEINTNMKVDATDKLSYSAPGNTVDSVHLTIPCKKRTMYYSARLTVSLTSTVKRLSAVSFEKNGEIAAVQNTEEGNTVIMFTKGNAPAVLTGSHSLTVSPEGLVCIKESEALKTVCFKDRDDTSVKEVRITLASPEDTVHYILPMTRVSLLNPKSILNPGAKPVSGGQETEGGSKPEGTAPADSIGNTAGGETGAGADSDADGNAAGSEDGATGVAEDGNTDGTTVKDSGEDSDKGTDKGTVEPSDKGSGQAGDTTQEFIANLQITEFTGSISFSATEVTYGDTVSSIDGEVSEYSSDTIDFGNLKDHLKVGSSNGSSLTLTFSDEVPEDVKSAIIVIPCKSKDGHQASLKLAISIKR